MSLSQAGNSSNRKIQKLLLASLSQTITVRMARRTTTSHVFTIIVSLVLAAGCKSVIDRQDVRPKVLRDVPSQNLAFRLTPDANAPADTTADDLLEKLETVATDFTTRRKDDALLRTV